MSRAARPIDRNRMRSGLFTDDDSMVDAYEAAGMTHSEAKACVDAEAHRVPAFELAADGPPPSAD